MTQTNPLAALGAHLASHGFTVELTAHGLKVANPQAAGCCEQVRRASDTITCRPRAQDGGRMWLWSSWGEPLAEADRITDATMAVKGNLADRSTRAQAQR